MGLIKLEVDRIQYNETQTGAYILFLKDSSSNKVIPIVIGGIEAHSIAIALEDNIQPKRPLTHDLMKNLMEQFQIKIEKVVIDKFEEGIFYAKLITKQNKKIIEIDSRTSDAVALAVRFKAPVYCSEDILNETGIDNKSTKISEKEIAEDEELMEVIQQAFDELIDEPDQKEDNTELTKLQKLKKEIFGKKNLNISKEEVEGLMQKAIEEEMYEKAAKLKKLLDLL